VDAGAVIPIHNAMFDIEMCRNMGIDLFGAALWDTMYAAYITCIEPQGMKPLARRWCGMKMRSYEETVGEAGLHKQEAYLLSVIEMMPWPKPDPRVEYNNDGTADLYTPQPVERRAEAILKDLYAGKLSKKGEPTDPYARWKKVDRDLKRMVEARLGPMPIGTLGDIPPNEATYYASRDPDATLRLYGRMAPALEEQGLTKLMAAGMEVLPVFEEMQASGMPASRSYFEQLRDDMWVRMCELQERIQNKHFGGKPFNPASPDQVIELMKRRKLKGQKSTNTGKVSTAKKSIEHLRYEDEAIADVIDWREHQKIKDGFCTPILSRIPDGVEISPIRTSIKTTRVATRRISASDPNLPRCPLETSWA